MSDPSPSNQSPSLIRRAMSVSEKTRQRGMGWLVQRILEEMRLPRTRAGHLLRPALAFLAGIAGRALGLLPTLATAPFLLGMNRLFVFYDLDSSPVTYDVVDHLVAAEMERRRRGMAHLHVVFVPGRAAGLREEETEYEASVGTDARRGRIANLLVQIPSLLPHADGYTVCSSRWQAFWIRSNCRAAFPKRYWPALPAEAARRDVFDAARRGETVFPMLRAPEYARAVVKDWLAAHLGSRKPVVISLREYSYMAARNSDRQAWVTFAESVIEDGFAPVFVPDTEATIPPPSGPGLFVFEPAAWNIALRTALYEQAYVNLAIAQGPMELCWFNEKARYVVFLPIGRAPQSSEDALRLRGLEPGRDLPFAKPWQRIVWEADTTEAIRQAFDHVCSVIDEAIVRGEL